MARPQQEFHRLLEFVSSILMQIQIHAELMVGLVNIKRMRTTRHFGTWVLQRFVGAVKPFS